MSTDPSSQYRWSSEPGDPDAHDPPPSTQTANTKPSITDPYADVLDVLSPRARRGLIAQLAVGFYDGWRPGRSEVVDLVAVKLGILTVEECERRRQLRNRGYRISDIDVIAPPKFDHPGPPRIPPPRRERDHRGQWTNRNPLRELSRPEAPHHEGQS